MFDKKPFDSGEMQFDYNLLKVSLLLLLPKIIQRKPFFNYNYSILSQLHPPREVSLNDETGALFKRIMLHNRTVCSVQKYKMFAIF
jgi:hypothetical protein